MKFIIYFANDYQRSLWNLFDEKLSSELTTAQQIRFNEITIVEANHPDNKMTLSEEELKDGEFGFNAEDFEPLKGLMTEIMAEFNVSVSDMFSLTIKDADDDDRYICVSISYEKRFDDLFTLLARDYDIEYNDDLAVIQCSNFPFDDHYSPDLPDFAVFDHTNSEITDNVVHYDRYYTNPSFPNKQMLEKQLDEMTLLVM